MQREFRGMGKKKGTESKKVRLMTFFNGINLLL